MLAPPYHKLKQLHQSMVAARTNIISDPSLDLYFGVQPDSLAPDKYKKLDQLLPLAWSHNPLTTLKLICNLRDDSNARGKSDEKAFYRAALWLRKNHPRALKRNVASIARGEYTKSVGTVDDLAQILYCITRTLRGTSEPVRYYDCLPPNMGSSVDGTTRLCESIAKTVFPRESYPDYQGLEEARYSSVVRDRLRKEVLVPLNKYLAYEEPPHHQPKGCDNKKHLEEVNANPKNIEAATLLPHEIVEYANDGEVGKAAELQWKTMVEDIYSKHGKFKNCVVVCDVSPFVAKLYSGVFRGLGSVGVSTE
ncbi:hypothetical protein ACFX1Q_016677 [Malus domestica]